MSHSHTVIQLRFPFTPPVPLVELRTVGTYFKVDGVSENQTDRGLTAELMGVVTDLRASL